MNNRTVYYHICVYIFNLTGVTGNRIVRFDVFENNLLFKFCIIISTNSNYVYGAERNERHDMDIKMLLKRLENDVCVCANIVSIDCV